MATDRSPSEEKCIIVEDKLTQEQRIRMEAIGLARETLSDESTPPSTATIIREASKFEKFIKDGRD